MRIHLPAYARHYTFTLSVQVWGFEDNCLLAQRDRLLCDFCSSGQRFACGFLQIPPHDGHPCRPANSPPVGPVVDWPYQTRFIFRSLPATALALIIVALAPTAWLLIPGFVILGIGLGLFL